MKILRIKHTASPACPAVNSTSKYYQAVVFILILLQIPLNSLAIDGIMKGKSKNSVEFITKRVETANINPPDTTDRKTVIRNARGTQDFTEGYEDALKFHVDNNPFLATFLTTSLLPPAGLVTTVVLSFTPVNEKKVPFHYPNLKNNGNYYLGYIEGVGILKTRKSWLGFGTGLIFFTGIVGVIKVVYFQ